MSGHGRKPSDIELAIIAQMGVFTALKEHKTAELLKADKPADKTVTVEDKSKIVIQVPVFKLLGAGARGEQFSAVYDTTDSSTGTKRIAKTVNLREIWELPNDQKLIKLQNLNDEIAMLRRYHHDHNDDKIEVYVTPRMQSMIIVQPKAEGIPARSYLNKLMKGVDDTNTPEALEKLREAMLAFKTMLEAIHKLHADFGIVHTDAWMDNLFLVRDPTDTNSPCTGFKVEIIDFGAWCKTGTSSEDYLKRKGEFVGAATSPPELFTATNNPDIPGQTTIREHGEITTKTDLYTMATSFIIETGILGTDFTQKTPYTKIMHDFFGWAISKACNHQNFWAAVYSDLPLFTQDFKQMQRSNKTSPSANRRDTDTQAIQKLDEFILQIDRYKSGVTPNYDPLHTMLTEFDLGGKVRAAVRKIERPIRKLPPKTGNAPVITPEVPVATRIAAIEKQIAENKKRAEEQLRARVRPKVIADAEEPHLSVAQRIAAQNAKIAAQRERAATKKNLKKYPKHDEKDYLEKLLAANLRDRTKPKPSASDDTKPKT